MTTRLLIALLAGFYIWPAQAGDWEELLFLEGKLQRPHELSAGSTGLSSKYNRLNRKCDFDPEQICIEWVLSLSSPLQENEAKLIVEDALNVWTQGASLPINFIYAGLSETSELPYRRDPQGQIELDEFDNPILEGAFVVGFENSPEVEFATNEISKTLKYIQYDSEASVLETKWAGIFIRPDLNPLSGCSTSCLETAGFASYSLRSVLVYEIGRMLGLGPSGLGHSVMYPSQLPSSPKRYDYLRADDKSWVRKLYNLNVSGSGSLSGEVIDGLKKEYWEGAQILALPYADIENFSESVDLHLFTQAAFAKQDGRFRFPALPEGSYILLAEAMNGNGLDPQYFDDWLQVFGSSENFEPDFYDGKGRESNDELLRYSPRGVWFAAIVHIVAGEETSNVQIITNVFDKSVERLEAVGSTNESLSEYEPQDISDDLKEQAYRFGKPGGCSLVQKSNSGIDVFWFGLIGILLVLRRRSLSLQAELDRPIE